VSNQECAEIVRRARHYLRVVRNVADNADLDGDLARLERGCKHNSRCRAGNKVLHLAQFRHDAERTLYSTDMASSANAEGRGKSAPWSFLIDLGLFVCFVCLLWSLCSLVSMP